MQLVLIGGRIIPKTFHGEVFHSCRHSLVVTASGLYPSDVSTSRIAMSDSRPCRGSPLIGGEEFRLTSVQCVLLTRGKLSHSHRHFSKAALLVPMRLSRPEECPRSLMGSAGLRSTPPQSWTVFWMLLLRAIISIV